MEWKDTYATQIPTSPARRTHSKFAPSHFRFGRRIHFSPPDLHAVSRPPPILQNLYFPVPSTPSRSASNDDDDICGLVIGTTGPWGFAFAFAQGFFRLPVAVPSLFLPLIPMISGNRPALLGFCGAFAMAGIAGME
ncbi:hypothetical protein Vi05172_g13249 [Venturia inaequalis]|nr:hypothetical protein Vi05172_g13249 [Venturia inaequalis]